MLLQNLSTNGLNAKLDVNHPLRNDDEKPRNFDILSIDIKPESSEISTEIPDYDSLDLITKNKVQEILINKKEIFFNEHFEYSSL